MISHKQWPNLYKILNSQPIWMNFLEGSSKNLPWIAKGFKALSMSNLISVMNNCWGSKMANSKCSLKTVQFDERYTRKKWGFMGWSYLGLLTLYILGLKNVFSLSWWYVYWNYLFQEVNIFVNNIRAKITNNETMYFYEELYNSKDLNIIVNLVWP